MFWSNQRYFTYHSASFDCFKNRSNNEAYNFKQLKFEININETMETKYY